MNLELKKVFLNEDERIDVQYGLDMSSVDFNGTKPFQTPIKVDVNIENHEGVVYLKSNVLFDFYVCCDRCAVDLLNNYNYSFIHILVMDCEGNDNDDFIEIQDYQLDLDELIKQDILMELPSKFLCCDDCKGLCPICGKNLNQGSCDCASHQVDPRLEVLENLLD